MIGNRIIPFLLVCILLIGACKKENGKFAYEMRLMFDSGDTSVETGDINEKSKDKRSRVMHVNIFNELIFIKVKDKQLVCSDEIAFRTTKPANFSNGTKTGFYGDIYFEGNYSQKGRAYTVEDGYFEFVWRNPTTGAPVDSIVHKGRWTLKRK